MDHSRNTTARLSKRSSKPEIEDAVRGAYKAGMREFKECGTIGRTKQFVSFEEVKMVAKGLAIESAHRIAGSQVEPFIWNRNLGSPGTLMLWGKKQMPYGYTNETTEDYELRRQEHQRAQENPWRIPDEEAVLTEIEALAPAEEGEEGKGWREYLASLSPEERAKVAKIEDESPRDKIQRGLQERDEKRGVSSPGSLQTKKEIDLNDPDSWSASDKIKIGAEEQRRLAELEK